MELVSVREDGIDWLRIKTSKDITQKEVNDYLHSLTPDKDKWLQELVKKLPQAKQYLARNQDKYPWSSFVLQYGEEFNIPTIKNNHPLIKMGECFLNAGSLTRFGPKYNKEFQGIQYAEGLTIIPYGYYHHGWNIYNGVVFDPTWGYTHLNSYFGIQFEMKACYEIFGCYRSVLCN